MACTRKRKRTINLLSPIPEPETLPPLLPTRSLTPWPNTPTTQIMQRVWSKFDVILIIKGMVNYIAEMGVDPLNNLDQFVAFINKNSSSSFYNGYYCSNITSNLGGNGIDIEKNCTLHLETRDFVSDKDLNLGKNDCGKSVKKKKGSVVDDVRVLNLGKNDSGNVKKGSVVDNVSNSGNHDGGVSCLGSVNNGKKKGSSVVENVSNSGLIDGGVSCLSSVKDEKGFVVGDKDLNLGKNDCRKRVKKEGSFVGDVRALNLEMNDGGSLKKKKKKKKGSVVDNVSSSGKNDGGVSCLGSVNNGKKKGSSVVENVSNSGLNDGGVSCLSSVKNEKGFVVGDKDLNLGKNDCRKRVKKEGSFVGDVRALNLEMNDGGSLKKKKKGSVVDNVSNSGKNDGGVSCLSSVKKKEKEKEKKRSGVSENKSNLRNNEGGVSCSITPNSVIKSNHCENKSNSRKNNGGISCLSSPNSVKRSNRSEKKSNSRKINVKKSGVLGKRGNCKENVGRNKCVSSRKDVKKSKLGVDYGGVYCTKTRKDMKKRRYWVGVNKRTFWGRIRRARKAVVAEKKSILKGKEDSGGNKQNDSNKNACRDNSVIQVKKGGAKNNNGGCPNLSDFGCWDKNEVILREAVRRMISRRLSLRDELETDLLWCPPKIGVLKWNTDASVREDVNKAAIGGVLRDWNGSFRCVFSCPLDCCGSNEAEVRAIYKALEIASCKDWLLNLHMVIESDSMNAVRWCNKDNGGPLNLGYMLSFIRECRRWWPGLEIIYAGRKSNSVADRLSKQGHQRSADFVAWM